MSLRSVIGGSMTTATTGGTLVTQVSTYHQSPTMQCLLNIQGCVSLMACQSTMYFTHDLSLNAV